MLNEILQWIVIITLAVPKIVQVVQDFKEEEEDE